MADDKELVRLMVNYHKGLIPTNYSKDDCSESIREGLVALNGGSTKLDYRAIRDGKCSRLFSVMEEVITRTVIEGLPENCPLMKFADFRNVARGDSKVFIIEDDQLFVVANIADGTQALRRQRLSGGEEFTVKTHLNGIKIYEELDRILAKRVDFNVLIDKVSKSFIRDLTLAIYNATTEAFKGLATPYKEQGTYDEAKLLSVCDHVKAKTGKNVMILCSEQAARKITNVKGADSHSAREDLYAMGYYGHIPASPNIPIVTMQNGHKFGTDEFILDDSTLYIVGADDNFIKVVHEGDTLIIPGDPTDNQDLTMEYFCAQRVGIAVVMKEQFGVYEMV